MSSKPLVFFLFSVLELYSYSEANIYHLNNERQLMDDIDKTVIELLNNCHLQLKNVLLYDNRNTSSILSTLKVLQPSIVVSIKSIAQEDQQNYLANHKIYQGIIAAIDVNKEWEILSKNNFSRWHCEKNCTMIFISKSKDFACSNVEMIMTKMAMMTVSLAYFICVENSVDPVIYTHDLYGDTGPPLWQVIKQSKLRYNDWVLYRRNLHKEICQEFVFNRTNPLDNGYFLFGELAHVSNVRIVGETVYDGSEIDTKMESDRRKDVIAIIKLLKIKIKYIEKRIFFANYSYEVFWSMFTSNSIDVNFGEDPVDKLRNFVDVSYPATRYDLAILSTNQGFNTPLEKIINFFGLYTLLSLLIMMIITFLVVWLKTTKNISFACFDILRLLTNNGVFVLINTLPLKIFFTVVFIYFLVIQALFSGHLAEFLTVPKSRKNIDSLEDLINPRITKIYTVGFNYDNVKNQEILVKKTKTIDVTSCIIFTYNDKNSACIGPIEWFENALEIKDSLYISKNRLATMPMVYLYRERFIFKERFDWALMVLTETRILYHALHEQREMTRVHILRRSVRSQTDFRPINLIDIKFAFMLLIIGSSLGLVCFVFEIYMDKKSRKIRKIIRFDSAMTSRNRKHREMKKKIQKTFVQSK